MRRSTYGALAASLLVASLAPLTASGEVEVATRVAEIPGTGLAARLPVDWRVWSHVTGADPVVIASDVATGRTCSFGSVEVAVSAEGAAREASETVEAHKQLELEAYTALDIPVGNAVRVSYRYRSMPDEDRFILHEYFVSGPEGVASVYCSSVDPPADRWQSVVDALEHVEVDDSAPTPFDPRVEVPDHGFAVDFDEAWLVRPWPGLGPVLGGSVEDERPVPEVSMSVLRAVTAEGEPTDAECIVEDAGGVPGLPGADSPTEWQAALLASAGAQRQKTSVPEVATTDLPSGRALRVDWDRWRGMPATAWILLDGERRIVLLCRADEPPADAWRAIAESFEFLPPEA